MKRMANLCLAFLFCCCTYHSSSIEKPLTFFVIGDWGRGGEPNQQVVADQMNEWAGNENPDFIITTGDNFYEAGVSGVDDPQWTNSFLKVYNGERIKEKTWYASLGNHDYVMNPEAEIEYSKVNPRWQLPSHYYEKVVRLPDNGSVRLIFIDSSPFERSYYASSFANSISRQDTARQKRWLDSLTALKDVDWKIVVGHHHIYTGGLRKSDLNTVRSSLEPIFEKNKVDVYFCGHEHDLQHLKPSNKATHYFLSGAGSETRPTGMIAESLFSQSIQGFMCVQIIRSELQVKVISYKGDVIYHYEIKK